MIYFTSNIDSPRYSMATMCLLFNINMFTFLLCILGSFTPYVSPCTSSSISIRIWKH
ncbi:transmembrane protein, putative [Medicago truncatula]|uniref:Transmembrane protein, putative n=1 Tax=Medicago truncatula TaxID=3880 RepID=G7KWU4_MEDTR|nr:transmembrane protein, putative [Medicago truncatula]